MMDFTLAESQQVVADLASQVLAAPDPWKELAQAGLLQLGVPETTVLLTEMGRRAAPDSVKALATLMTGALPVARWGSAALQQELLPAIAVRRADPHRRPPRALRPSPSDPSHHSHQRKESPAPKSASPKPSSLTSCSCPPASPPFHDHGSSRQIAPKLAMIMVSLLVDPRGARGEADAHA